MAILTSTILFIIDLIFNNKIDHKVKILSLVLLSLILIVIYEPVKNYILYNDSLRLRLWTDSINCFRWESIYLFFGYGTGTAKELIYTKLNLIHGQPTSIHNEYIKYIIDFGVLPVFCFFILYPFGLLLKYKEHKNSQWYRFTIFSFLVLLLMSITDQAISYNIKIYLCLLTLFKYPLNLQKNLTTFRMKYLKLPI